jgi:hypothetical protein
MMHDPFATRKEHITFISLIPYLLMTFAITWAILSLYIFLPEQMNTFFGQITGNHPLFFLAVYAPAIAAFVIVSYRTGLTGLHRYLTRFFIWRCSVGWGVFLLIGIPFVFYAGAAWKATLLTDPFPFSSLSTFCWPLSCIFS